MTNQVSSMTGFGRAEGRCGIYEVAIEVKSVNNRFLELSFRLPRDLQALEMNFRSWVSSKLKRGTIQLSVQMQKVGESEEIEIDINHDLASAYIRASEELKSKHNIGGSVTLLELMKNTDIVKMAQKESMDEKGVKALEALVKTALDDLSDMKLREGLNMRADLEGRVDRISSVLDEVEVQLPIRQAEHHEKMQKRLQDLLGDQEMDEARLNQEIAHLADKMDVAEELTRFRSHNELFMESLAGKGPHGKRLNFLLQEMGREANTLGTKSIQSTMQHLSIALKEEVESIREQVLNIE